MPQQPTPREEALRLAGLGYSVVSVYPMRDGRCACGRADCASPGKHPIGGDTKATTDPQTIEAMYRAWPDANLGINLGMSGLLDVSSDNTGTLADFRQRGLEPTGSFESGSGAGHEHHTYALPPGAPQVRKCESGIYDLMSAGIAVVPPSVSGKGGYRWLRTIEEPVAELPVAPAWAVAELSRQRERDEDSRVDHSEPPVRLFGEALRRWNGESQGDRSRLLLDIANDLAKAGATAAGIYAALSDRDEALGLGKYSTRTDADVRYAELATSAVHRFGLSRLELVEENDRFPMLDIDELLNRPAIGYLIDGIVSERGFVVAVGDPGVGKSFLMLDMALSVATGRDWYGFACKKSGPVLYVAAERDGGLGKRALAWLDHRGVDRSEARGFRVLPRAVLLLDQTETTGLIAAIRERYGEESPVLVVIDTLARTFVGGNENQQEDMERYTHAVALIQREFECAVVVIHHNNKAGDMRGSSVLPGAIDGSIAIQRTATGVGVTCGKANDDAEFKPFSLVKSVVPADGLGPLVPGDTRERQTSLVFERQEVTIRKDGDTIEVTGSGLDSLNLTDQQQRAFAVLAEAGLDGLRSAAWQRATGITVRQSWSNVLRALLGAGLVSKEQLNGNAVLYRVSRGGQQWAASL